MEERELSQNKMGTARMFPLILSMAVPAMFSMLVQAFTILWTAISSPRSAKGVSRHLFGLSHPEPADRFRRRHRSGRHLPHLPQAGPGQAGQGRQRCNAGILLSLCTYVLFALYGAFSQRPSSGCSNLIRKLCRWETLTSPSAVFSPSGLFVQISLEKDPSGHRQYDLAHDLPTGGSGEQHHSGPHSHLRHVRHACHERGRRSDCYTVGGQIIAMIFSIVVVVLRGARRPHHLPGLPAALAHRQGYLHRGLPAIVMQSIGTVMTWPSAGFSPPSPRPPIRCSVSTSYSPSSLCRYSVGPGPDAYQRLQLRRTEQSACSPP